ncbi:MAG: 3-hydroxyacyl-CoA dehydrogenase NAD-binding domain-containing protein, partial [Saprospiraceae bacterium]|nr:3-hydroxyacyl-CoA dehydrogenase NAD-binding domain-containing protein [Saprospiraceae bacterium]
IEVVVERLDIKQQILAQVDEHRRPGSIVSSNTSGIPIHLMLEGRSDDFKQHFLGTHFFNPPRYLRLLEIIPTAATDPDLVDFMMHYGDVYLGKETVRCNDTPAFIANRVGVYAMSLIFQLTGELGLTIQDVDKLTGPAIGRPKTGTFRLGDLVGLDVALKVTQGMQHACPDDEQVQALETPRFMHHLIDNSWLGNKSGQGFYQRTSEKDEKGRTVILGLNLETLEYERPQRSSLPSLTVSKQIEDLPRRIQTLFDADDAGGALIRKSLAGLFAYVSKRIPEISDQIYPVDAALKAGFAWDLGPFEYWDTIGIEKGLKAAEAEGYRVAPWVGEMLAAGHTSFYRIEDGRRQYYDPETQDYHHLPGAGEIIHLDSFRAQKPVYENDEVVVHDIGEQVLCLEFRSKMNAIGEGILRGIGETITLAEDGDWRGLVIGNHSKNFSVGANLMLLAMLAFEEEWDEVEMAVALFQNTAMRCRYSAIPVVMATQGYVFGGSCELAMHCDAVYAAAESYLGQVEVGVGLIPGGAGTKEFALRASDSYFEGDVQIPTLVERFKTLAMGTVGTSANEAFDLGLLDETRDHIVMNQQRNITEAKEAVIHMSEGYVMPIERDDVHVLGRTGLGALYTAANELYRGNWVSEHDIKIARHLAYVLCGGDLSAPQKVTERYLLDIERERFLQLMGEQKTLERIQYMLQNGKPLRN